MISSITHDKYKVKLPLSRKWQHYEDQPGQQAEAACNSHDQQPDPDNNVDVFTELVDRQLTLMGVSMNIIECPDGVIAQNYPWKDR